MKLICLTLCSTICPTLCSTIICSKNRLNVDRHEKGEKCKWSVRLYVRKYVRKSFVLKNKLNVERLEKGEEMQALRSTPNLTKSNLTLEKLLKKLINSNAKTLYQEFRQTPFSRISTQLHSKRYLKKLFDVKKWNQ